MNATLQLVILVMPVLFLEVHNLPAQEDQGPEKGKALERGLQATCAERPRWTVQTKQQASTLVARLFGTSGLPESRCASQLVTLKTDNTPFLADQLVGIPLWQVEVHLALELKSADTQDTYERVFDTFVDPVDGRVLKIISRWPVGVPAIAPMPSAVFAEQCMRRSGDERYHGFPQTAARISFLEALDVVYRKGVGNPLIANQIMGQYVLRSQMGKQPRAVWAITLWGIPSLPLARRGVPVDARNHIRNIVDATTGEWLSAGTSPQPEPQPAPRRARIKGPVPAP